MTTPPQITRARMIAGILLAITVLLVVVSAILIVNWWMNRPVSL